MWDSSPNFIFRACFPVEQQLLTHEGPPNTASQQLGIHNRHYVSVMISLIPFFTCKPAGTLNQLSSSLNENIPANSAQNLQTTNWMCCL